MISLQSPEKSRNRMMRVILATLFIMFSIPSLAIAGDPSGYDVSLFRLINNNQSSGLTSILEYTDDSVWPLGVGAPIGILAVGTLTNDRKTLEVGSMVLCAEALSYGTRLLLKVAIKRKRPYEVLDNVNIHHLNSADPYSFPSGHTTGAFALATMLTLAYPKPAVYIPAFLWAGAVAYGRIYFGLHYPSDVLGGIMIGSGSAVLVYRYRQEISNLVGKIIGNASGSETTALVLPISGGMITILQIRF
jgi:membrane-associated phospholipid phosphatase